MKYNEDDIPVHFPIRANEPYVAADGNWHSSVVGPETSTAGPSLEDWTPVVTTTEFDRLVIEARKLLAELGRRAA